MSTSEIKAIIPCQGEWVAKYINKTTEEESEYPIACWALIVEHLDEDEQKQFGQAQFEFVRGLTPILGAQDLAEPFEETSEDFDFVGYEKFIQSRY